MHIRQTAGVIIGLILFAYPTHLYAATNGPLHSNPANPNYFFDKNNKPVYLTGSHTWGVMYDPAYIPPTGTEANHSFYKILTDNKHNFMRFWQDDLFASIEGGYGTIDPKVERYVRTTDGKFDLTKFNPTYNQHLRALVDQARQKDIYVSIMFTNGWVLASGDPTNWDQAVWPYNYFYPGNSIQNRTGTTKDNVYTTSSPVNDLFKLHIKNVVDTVGDLDNVMFEIINEAGGSNMDWQQDMLAYLRTLTTKPIGITTGISCNLHINNYPNSADWVSPCGSDLKSNMPAQSTSKVVLLDTDHIWGEGGNDDWVWQSFTRGYNPIYMDNLQGSTDALAARKAMGVTNWLANTRIQNLAGMRPSTPPCNTDFCLSNGNEVVLYYPSGSPSSPLGAGWQYEYYNTQSNALAGPGAKVVYASNQNNPPPQNSPTPNTTPSPSNTPVPAGGWTFCANEDGICSFTGTKYVRYGLNSTYNYGTYTNSVSCSNAIFGDPATGADKHCDYQNVGSSPLNLLRAYLTSTTSYDLNGDNLVNSLDFALAIK